MSDAVEDLIRKFVVELKQLVRESIVRELLAGESISSGRKTIPIAAPGKRTPEVIASQANAMLVYIRRHPGCSAVEIAKGLEVELKELALPLAKLKADKAIKVTGVRRCTKYTAK